MVEDVLDLADPEHAAARVGELIQGRRRGRRHAVVATFRSTHERVRRPVERPGDHAPDSVAPGQERARDLAPAVQLRERDDVDVRGDLEHRVAARVHDGAPGGQMVDPQLGDDLGPRGRHVAEDPTTDRRLERLDHLGWEPVRIQRKRLLESDPHHLPMAGRGVLPGRQLRGPSVRGARFGARRDTGDVAEESEPERLERGDA